MVIEIRQCPSHPSVEVTRLANVEVKRKSRNTSNGDFFSKSILKDSSAMIRTLNPTDGYPIQVTSLYRVNVATIEKTLVSAT